MWRANCPPHQRQGRKVTCLNPSSCQLKTGLGFSLNIRQSPIPSASKLGQSASPKIYPRCFFNSSLNLFFFLPSPMRPSCFKPQALPFPRRPPGLHRRVRRGQREKCLVATVRSYSLTRSLPSFWMAYLYTTVKTGRSWLACDCFSDQNLSVYNVRGETKPSPFHDSRNQWTYAS